MSVTHQLSATTPDDPSYEIRPSHWNQPHVQAFTILGNTAGASTVSGTNVQLSAGPNATISVNGSTLVFSGGAGAAGNTGYLSDGAGVTASLGTIRLSDANGISFGLNGQTLTLSHNGLTAPQTGISGIIASNATYTSGTVSFSNQNGVTIGSSVNGATQYVRLSVATSYAASDHSHGNPTLNLTNLSGTTASNSAGLTLSLSAAAPGAATLTVSAVGNTTVNSSGTWPNAVSLRAYGILSAGTSNGSLLLSTPDPVDFTALSVGNSNLGNTAGDTGVFTGRVVFVGSNNITLSGSSNGGSQTISIIGGAGGAGFSAGVSTGGNTAGATGVTGTRLVFVGSNNVTLSQTTDANGGTVTVLGANTHAQQTGISGIVASDTTYTSGTVSFSNQNGVTIGSSVNGATQYIRLSVANQSAQTGISGIVASDTTYTSGTVSFSNQNGVTIGSSVDGATQYVRLSVANQTNQTLGLYASSNTTAQSSSTTVDARSLTVRGVGAISAGYSAGELVLSVAAGAQSNQTLGIYNSSQTTGGSSSSTYDARSLTIAYSGNISGGWTNGSMLLTVAPQSNQTVGMYATGNTTNNSSTTFDARTLGSINAQGALTAGFSNGSIQLSVPATSSIVGTSGVSISTNGSTISVGLSMRSYFGNMNGEWGNSTTLQVAQSTSHIQPFVLDGAVSFGQIRIPMSASMAASSTGATTGNSQFSYGLTRSHNFVIYSRGTGGNSMSLQSVMSTQLTDRQSINVSAAANSTQFSYTNRASYQMSTGEVAFTFDYSSSAASLNFHTSGMTAITGLKQMEFKWQNSLAPGQYWLMYGVSSSTQSQYTAQGTRLFNIFSGYGVSQPNLQFGTIGGATHNSVGLLLGNGSFTTVGGGTTESLPISAVTTTASHIKPVFQLFHIA